MTVTAGNKVARFYGPRCIGLSVQFSRSIPRRRSLLASVLKVPEILAVNPDCIRHVAGCATWSSCFHDAVV